MSRATEVELVLELETKVAILIFNEKYPSFKYLFKWSDDILFPEKNDTYITDMRLNHIAKN